MHTIDGRKISKDILEGIKKEVLTLSFVPVFCDVLVGDDIVSKQYVNLKRKKAESIGINFYDASFPVGTTTEEVISKIEDLNKMEYMCGIIVQLPLPAHLDTIRILNAIDPKLDVDCLGSTASDLFYKGEGGVAFPTALACMRILEEVKIDLSSSNVVVLGQGELVGKPVSHLLTRNNIKHICLHSKSENTMEVLKNADLIISGIGREHFIKNDMIKNGVSIIDAGTSESEGSVVGDVDADSVMEKVNFISPVPGGVGPVTVAMLFKNVLNVAKKISKNV